MPDHRYDANRLTVGALLSTTSPRIQVPEWQRSYAWEGPQLEAFWADLLAFEQQYPGKNIENQEYFLGSIVLVTGGLTNLLLDGQQRLATATILLSVLRDARATFKADSATRLQAKYISELDDATNVTTYVLTLNRYDRDFFRAAVQDEHTVPMAVPVTLKSHARIRQAREYFQARVGERYATTSDPKAAFTLNLRIGKVLTDHMSVVVVSSSDEDNAASVFETLNDRGIGLATPDLLRNLLLRRATDEPAREGIVSAWQTVLGIEDEVSANQFLRHYWVSIRGDVKSHALYREMKNTILAEDIDSLSLSQDLAKAAVIYRDLVNASAEDVDLKRSLIAIDELGASVAYPALLSAEAVTPDEPGKVAELAATLITLFIRYNVIGGRETTVLETTVYKVASSLRQTKDFAAAITQLAALAPDMTDFNRQFARAVVSRRATARYILRELEHARRLTEELSVEGTHSVHVEHIYPQQPREGQRLPNHATVLNRLGNLTLLSRKLNTSIRNADFVTKKVAYSKSELLITRDLVNFDGPWDTIAIDVRQRELASKAVDIWHFPGEQGPPGRAPHDEPIETSGPAQLPEVPDSAVDAVSGGSQVG